MRVLILTITAGQGHHAAAQSVADALSERNIAVRTIDVYKTINKALASGVNNFYLFATKYIPKLYSKAYSMLEGKERQTFIQEIGNLLMASKFVSHIESYSPDFIVCTHIFAAQIVDELKKKGKLAGIPTVGIVTDYTLHPFWEAIPNVEYVNLASPLLVHGAKKRGIPEDRLVSFGIPVQLKFSKRLPREEAAKQLGIDPNRRTLLIMAGSMGYGNIVKHIRQIMSLGLDLQILAVCGNNKRQYKKIIDANFGSDVHPFGFVNNVDVMMDAADCIMTKPGGLTVTESIEKQLPLILINPIPGQEERNMDFLLNNGIALSVTKSFPADEAINYLFNCPGRIDAIKSRLHHIVNPQAARSIASFIIENARKESTD